MQWQYSTYVLEVGILTDLNWVERHRRLYNLHSRTRDATMRRMPPDLVLYGSCTGRLVDAGEVIPLKDRVLKQAKLTKYFKVFKKRSTPFAIQHHGFLKTSYRQLYWNWD